MEICRPISLLKLSAEIHFGIYRPLIRPTPISVYKTRITLSKISQYSVQNIGTLLGIRNGFC
jgi:hypothetical protein